MAPLSERTQLKVAPQFIDEVVALQEHQPRIYAVLQNKWISANIQSPLERACFAAKCQFSTQPASISYLKRKNFLLPDGKIYPHIKRVLSFLESVRAPFLPALKKEPNLFEREGSPDLLQVSPTDPSSTFYDNLKWIAENNESLFLEVKNALQRPSTNSALKALQIIGPNGSLDPGLHGLVHTLLQTHGDSISGKEFAKWMS